jgi:hypothetical protein
VDDLAAPLDVDGVVARRREIVACPESEGVAGLVEQWLRAFGPGAAADLRWWLGSTLAVVRRGLAELGAIEVDLDGRTGYLLPDFPSPLWSAMALRGQR